MADNEVHPEQAIELVRKLRRRGGAWRLLQTGLVVTAPAWLLAALAAMNPLGILVSAGATALLVRNLVQNSRAIRADELLRHVEALAKPLVAVMDGRMLRIGTANTPQQTWRTLHISVREEGELRQLALPAARVIED